MTNSLKMARLDTMTLKSSGMFLMTALVMIGFGIMIGSRVLVESSYFIAPFMAAWMTALTPMTIFSIQEKSRLDCLYGSTSMRKKDIVAGRFVFNLVFYIMALLIGTVSLCSMAVVQGFSPHYLDVLQGCGVSFLIFSILVGAQMPLYFKFGYLKARVWTSAVLAVMLLAVMFTPSLIGALSNIVPALLGLSEFIQNNYLALSLVGVAIACLIQFASYRLSVIAYRKRC